MTAEEKNIETSNVVYQCYLFFMQNNKNPLSLLAKAQHDLS